MGNGGAPLLESVGKGVLEDSGLPWSGCLNHFYPGGRRAESGFNAVLDRAAAATRADQREGMLGHF